MSRPFTDEGEALLLASEGNRLLAMAAITADPLWMIRPLADFVSFMFGKPPADEASPIEWSGTAWRSPGGAGGRFAFIPIMPSRLDYTSATASTAPGPIRARRIQWLSLRRHRDTIIHNS